MDRSPKQKINKETQVLSDALDQMDLADILRIFYSNSEEYIFISSVHGTFSRIDHILGHKSNLNKFNKIEIVSSIFSDDKAMSLRYQLQEKNKKNPTLVNFQMFKLVLEKAEELEVKLPTSAGSWKKQESSRKTSISALLTMPKPLTVWITINCGKF